MSSHEHYDKLLRELPKDGGLVGQFALHDVDLHYLSSCNYVNLTLNEFGAVFLVGITKEGLKFISEGGFKAQDEAVAKRQISEKLQNENWIATTRSAREAKTTSIISIIIAALSLIVAAIALLK